MIKAVIFDCFGVLATEAWLPFKQKHFGDNPEMFRVATDIARRTNRGLIGSAEFISEISKLSNVESNEVRRMVTGNVPNEPLFDYLKLLKAHYKLGLLSNIGGDRLNQMFKPEQLALFDAVALSFEIGFVKPEPAAFKCVAEKLGLETAECVLVDDQQRNIEGAVAVGMAGILYQDINQLKKELNRLLN